MFKKISIIGIFVSISLLMTACVSETQGDKFESTSILNITSVHDTSEDIVNESGNNGNYDICMQALIAESEENIAYVEIPTIVSDSDNFEYINGLIYGEISDFVSRYVSEDLYLNDDGVDFDWNTIEYEKLALNATCQIKCRDDERASFVFKGMWNVKGEPHPNHFSFSINIDMKKQDLVKVSSIYDFNESFIEWFNDSKKQWVVRSEHKDVVDGYIDKEMLKELLNDDNTWFYFSEDNLGIIMNCLPFAAGNYFTFEIPYSEMVPFEK